MYKFVFHKEQIAFFENHFLDGYITGFDSFLREEYPQLEPVQGEDRTTRIRSYHEKARQLGMNDYKAINTFIICCFIYGADRLIADEGVIDHFTTAIYEPDSMIMFLNNHFSTF